MANFDVTALPAYVEQRRDDLLNKLVFEGRTISRMRKQTGIKTKAAINYLDTAPVFQDGSTCGFNAQGTVALTQREISTGVIKVNMEICPKTLLGTYAEYLVRMSALAEAERMPFEEYVLRNIVNKIKKGMEVAVWQGDTASEDAGLKHFDGLLKIAQNDAGVVDAAISAITTPESAYNAIQQMYLAIPEPALDNNARIFVSPAVFRLFSVAMVQKNYFHYSGAQDEDVREFVFPGTNVRVVSTEGLAGTNYMLASTEENMYYGTDREGDEEDIKLWFSDDDDIWKLKVQWNAGVQFAFPDHVVLGTIAA